MKGNVSLIIAAAGAGKRFFRNRKANALAKVFQPLAGKPLLSHTLDSFQGLPEIREILIALPRGTEPWVRANILWERWKLPIRLVLGGATRAESVLNALRRTSPRNEWVAVHDGARPFPPQKMVSELFQKAKETDAVILARPVVPTLKRVSGENGRVAETVDRTHLFEAETPQLVRRSVLLKAYEKNPEALRATDESSLVESVGGRVKVVSHSGWNVKVTTREDLRLAEAYYEQRNRLFPLNQPSPPWGERARGEGVKIGFGKDTHRLVRNRKFYLGGIQIPFKKGALGHSDGDALLHAISDALLGALGAGDIGDWFSDKDPRNKNIRSAKILGKVLDETRRKGWAVQQVDSTVFLEKPRLGLLKKKIRGNLAKLLRLEVENISVKAKTLEGLGPEGEGLAVTCEAVVVLRKIS